MCLTAYWQLPHIDTSQSGFPGTQSLDQPLLVSNNHEMSLLAQITSPLRARHPVFCWDNNRVHAPSTQTHSLNKTRHSSKLSTHLLQIYQVENLKMPKQKEVHPLHILLFYWFSLMGNWIDRYAIMSPWILKIWKCSMVFMSWYLYLFGSGVSLWWRHQMHCDVTVMPCLASHVAITRQMQFCNGHEIHIKIMCSIVKLNRG